MELSQLLSLGWPRRGYQLSSHLPSDHHLLTASLPLALSPKVSSSASAPMFLLFTKPGIRCTSISHSLSDFTLCLKTQNFQSFLTSHVAFLGFFSCSSCKSSEVGEHWSTSSIHIAAQATVATEHERPHPDRKWEETGKGLVSLRPTQ